MGVKDEKARFRLINLEDGYPTTEQAIKRLIFEITIARRQGIASMKVIHGFGSSGVGGKIRVKSRLELDSMIKRNIIKDYIIGEKFSLFDIKTQSFLRTNREISGDSDLDRHNNGITVVIIR